MMIQKELLNVLACPACKSAVSQNEDDKLECTNLKCGLAYPVKDGIPIMLVEQAFKKVRV